MSKDILKIEIENIQAIAEAGLEVEGFTGLVGRSNIGKSALLRGLHAAITNKNSKAIYRNGTKRSSVLLKDSKGMTLKWEKGSTGNVAYTFNGDPYTKVGKERPDKLDEFGFKEVRINGDLLEVQFSRQHDYLFLIDKSGGFVADFISHITKVDVITGALKDCESDLRKANANVKASEEEILKLGDEVKKFDDLDYHGSIIKALQEIKAQALDRERHIIELDGLIIEKDKLVHTYKALKELPIAPVMTFDIEELSKIQALMAEAEQVKKFYLRTQEVASCKVPTLEFDVGIIKDIDECLEIESQANVSLPTVPSFVFDTSELKELSATIDDYAQVSGEISEIFGQYQALSKKEAELEAEKLSIEKTLGNCPFCKRGFQHDHAAHGGLDAIQ